MMFEFDISPNCVTQVNYLENRIVLHKISLSLEKTAVFHPFHWLLGRLSLPLPLPFDEGVAPRMV